MCVCGGGGGRENILQHLFLMLSLERSQNFLFGVNTLCIYFFDVLSFVFVGKSFWKDQILNANANAKAKEKQKKEREKRFNGV